MSIVSNLGYVVLGVSDLQRWESFAVEVLGLQMASKSTDSLGLRMDDYCQRIVLEKNPVDDIVAAGWEFDSEAELTAFVEKCRARGIGLEAMTIEHARNRKVERGYICPDPVSSYVHEFYFCPQMAPLNSPFASKHLKSSFVTGPLGVGHILPVTRNLAKSLEFFLDVLGLRISDYIREEVAPGFIIDATFLHTKTGRHHSVGLAEADLPKILSHLMVQVVDLDDVGLAYDRAARAGCQFSMEIGHHPNDRMTSFYVKSPSGFNIEYGFGGIVVDEATWTIRRYSQLSDWGHRRNPPVAQHPRNV
jgi:2,3-dihydroxybiphenyl 1,2-dioxygenase